MSLAVEPLDFGETEVVLISYELAGVRGGDLLPKGLHETIPTLLTITAWRALDIEMVQLRLSCRAGFRARAMLVGGAAQGSLAEALAKGWAYPAMTSASVRVERRYDRVAVSVVDAGVTVLDVSVEDPRPIAADDIQYVVGLNRGEVEGRGERLIQVEPHFEPLRAERGRPQVKAFDAAWFGDPRVAPAHPVAATISVGRLTLPPPRFAQRPDLPAWEGTETLAARVPDCKQAHCAHFGRGPE